jgi:hypothetical protein
MGWRRSGARAGVTRRGGRPDLPLQVLYGSDAGVRQDDDLLLLSQDGGGQRQRPLRSLPM